MNQLINLICSALVACALLHIASGYVTDYRSVKRCVDKQVSAEECEDICFNGTNLVISRLAKGFIAELEQNAEGSKKCCCKYDEPWNISNSDDWDPFEGNKALKTSFRLNLYVIWDNQPPCSPKRTVFITDKKETEAYKNMCKYVPSATPLSMLELGEFIDAVSYLRELTNKNMLVSWKLTRSYIPMFNTDLKKQFNESLNSLLDHSRDYRNPGGPPFDIDLIEKMKQVTSRLRQVFDNDVVHRAFDELIISIIMINMIDAEKWAMKINDGSMSRKLFHSLRKNGDYVDPLTANVQGFSCQKFTEARDILRNLVDTSRSALGTLNTPGAFNAMGREWRPMSNLENTIEVYDNLISARCTNVDANIPVLPTQLSVSQTPERPQTRLILPPIHTPEEYKSGKWSGGSSVGGMAYS